MHTWGALLYYCRQVKTLLYCHVQTYRRHDYTIQRSPWVNRSVVGSVYVWCHVYDILFLCHRNDGIIKEKHDRIQMNAVLYNGMKWMEVRRKEGMRRMVKYW